MSTAYDGVPDNVAFPATVNISATSNANPTQITTSTPHLLKTGTKVQIVGHSVNTGVNGIWTVTVTGASTFTIPVASTGDSSATGVVGSLRLGTSVPLPTDGTGGTSVDPANASSIATPLETMVDALAYLNWQLVANYFNATFGGTVTGATTFDTAIELNGPTTIGPSGNLELTAAQQIIAMFADSISSQIDRGIQSDSAGGISSNAVAGIMSRVDNGIALGGTVADWIRYLAARTRTRMQPLTPMVPTRSGWTPLVVPPGSQEGSATSTGLYVNLEEVLDGSNNGATLTSVKFRFAVAGPHSAVPNPLPTFDVRRVGYTVGASYTDVSLNSGGAQSPSTPGSGAAWDASSHIQELIFTCNQNNLIDKTQYIYYALIVDENTTAAVAGNTYLPLILTQGSIVNNGL